MPDVLFRCRNLTLARPGQTVLRGLDWSVERGRHWWVSGPNGAGKSTLAEALAGQHRAVSGERNWPGLGEDRRSKVRLISFTDTGNLFHNANAIHYYQQRYNAFDADGHLAVRDYLLAGGHSEASARAALGAGDLIGTERIKLSSGQTRKLLLARALAGKPELLIIDNPYLGLDAGSRVRLNQMLDELVARTGITLVLAGHVTELPRCVGYRLHLGEGRALYAGAMEGFRAPEYHPDTADAEITSVLHYDAKQHMLPDFDEVVRFEGVRVAYGPKVIFDHFDWRVAAGEKWVVAGDNGSGKSTLLSLLYADHPQVYANRVYLFGHRRGRGESIWEIKRRIGFTSPELHGFFDGSLTARAVVLSGLNDTFRPPAEPTAEQTALLSDLLAFAGLTYHAERPFNRFSTGEQRLLLLLRALIKLPPVLLLDEPFQGLDARTVARCRRLLAALLTPRRTMIFISHFREEWPEGVERTLWL